MSDFVRIRQDSRRNPLRKRPPDDATSLSDQVRPIRESPMSNQNFIGGAWVAARQRRDRRGREPGDRGGHRRGPGERRRRRRRRGRGRRAPRSPAWRGAHTAGAQRGTPCGRRRHRGRPGHDQAPRDGELRQARVDHRVRDGPHRRQLAVLRRRRTVPRGARRGRVPRGAHLATCGATRSAWSARSRRGTTRSTWRRGSSGPALAAGNTVVLKPSELTPLTALRLAEITADILPARRAQRRDRSGRDGGRRAGAPPDVAMVSLTGNVETGKVIARTAADTLKRVHLELGGKAPVIVFDDADVDAAVAMPRRDGLLQLRPGLHRPVPRDRRAEGLRRPRRRAHRRGRSDRHRRPVRRRTPRWGR